MSRGASDPRALLRAAVIAGGVTAGAGAAAADYEEEVVVTATMLRTPQLETPLAVSVVDGADVQAGQQLGLDEALNRVPGLFFQDRYNFAQDLRVSIRGFGARANFGIRGIQVVVDGIPSTLADGQSGVDDLDLGSVGRIEVIRGPSASLYGAASGGVIAITTEDPPAEPFVEGRVSVGEYDFQKYQLKAAGQHGALDWLVNASHFTLGGYRRHSTVHHTLVNSKLRWHFGEAADLTVIVNAVDSPKAQDPGGLTAAQVAADRKQARDRNVTFNAGESVEQQKLGWLYRRTLAPGHELTVNNYFVWRDFENRLPFQTAGRVRFDRFFVGGGARYEHDRMIGARRVRLLAGADVKSQTDDRKRFDNLNGLLGPLALDQEEQADAIGGFAQLEIDLTSTLRFSAGARYDVVDLSVDDRFLANGDQSGDIDFDELSHRLGLLWEPLAWVAAWFNYSTSFETPTFTELANPAAAGTAGGFNPSLTAQTADNLEVGVRLRPWSGVAVEATGFHITVDDEITNVVNVGGRSFFQNADTTRDGVEAALSLTPFAGAHAQFAYTYSDFTFDTFSVSPANNGNRLPGVPRHQFYAELGYRHPSGLHATWDWLHVGEFFADNANTTVNPAYTVSNLRFGRRWQLADASVEATFAIQNLFNERYNGNVRLNAFGGRFFEPAPERNVWGALTVRWGGPRGSGG